MAVVAAVAAAASDRASKELEEIDLGDGSLENFMIEGPAEGAAAVAAGDEEGPAVEALKHFWHMLLVAGFPMTPQLLTQSVKVSGTLNSVSSFSVFWAIGGIFRRTEDIFYFRFDDYLGEW